MAEEIQEAVQIIRVAYDGIEIAMKVGSGGLAAMQKTSTFCLHPTYLPAGPGWRNPFFGDSCNAGVPEYIVQCGAFL